MRGWLTLILVCCFLSGWSCVCIEFQSFQEVTRQSQVVALVEVVDFHYEEKLGDFIIPLAMDVKVDKVMKGELKVDKIRIWGNNGILCAPYLDHFSLNNKYIVALYPVNNRYINRWYFTEHLIYNKRTYSTISTATYNANIRSFSMTNCGESWMKVRGGNMIRGFLVGESINNPGVPADETNQCTLEEIVRFIK